MANIEAHAGPPPASTDLVKFSVRLPGIEMLLAAGLVLRLGLAFLPGFGVDIGTFQAWSNSLANDGPWNFYNETSFTDYAPGYMYVLWFIGEANQIFGFSQDQYEYILKIPAIIADIASALLIYRILADQKPGVRMGATALYLFFPAALWIGPIWGQVDSILAFFLLLSVYYIGRDKPVHGALAFTIGFLMKPQAIAVLPLLAFWIIRDNWGNWRPIVLCTVVPPLVMLVLITPFFVFEPWRLVEVLYDASNVANYRVNSFWAYNFWNIGGLFEQGFQCDSCGGTEGTTWFGIETRYWGLSFFFLAIAGVVFSLRKAHGTGYLALGVALSVMAFYFFLTRMHERYVFAAFLPLLVAAVLINSRLLWGMFVVLAVSHFVNLYHVYGYYYPNDLRIEGIYDWLEKGDLFGTSLPLLGRLETVQFFSILMVVSFLVLLVGTYIRLERRPSGPEAT
ncbi:MAG: hypothetical protein J4N72_03345 [Chloroflexi bacterium]|nr:hypothetical protein [Chloroflexota bacterium]